VDLVVTDDYDALSRSAAERIVDLILVKPTAALVLATGETPMGAYRELAATLRARDADVSRLRVFQLDEYLDLAPDDRRSLYGWMARAVLDPLGIPAANVVRLDASAPDLTAACRAYDDAVAAAGGLDLAVLGLGPNGHLGFNEPPAPPDAPTRLVTLTEASVASNGHYWGGADQVPRRAITAGMAVLLAARQTLLLVSGSRKRQILRRVVEGPVTPDVPASLLRRAAHVTVLTDRAAWPSSPVALAANHGVGRIA
jgi:glucosamine-6-phosphate deaminase